MSRKSSPSPAPAPDALPSPVFSFQSHEVRTTIVDDQPWFVAKDVAAALGLQWTGHALKSIPDGWQGVVKLTTPSNGYKGGGNQNLRIISEPAVYKLAFRSNKPEADVFTNWVASEVLPAIRRTGKYEAKPKRERKALPLAPQPSYREQCAEVTALPRGKRAPGPVEAQLLGCAEEISQLTRLSYEFHQIMGRAHRAATPLFHATYDALGWHPHARHGVDGLACILSCSRYRSMSLMREAFDEAKTFLRGFRDLARLHGM